MKVRACLMLATILISCGAAYWLGIARGKAGRPTGPSFLVVDGLAVEEAALDLGEAWAGQDVSPSITIHNRRSSPVEVQHFVTSCGHCSGVEPASPVIPAGGTASVRFHLNLAPRWQSEVAQADRAFVLDVRPVLKGGTSSQSDGHCDSCEWEKPARKGSEDSPPRSWPFRLLVKNPVTYDWLSIHFGDSPTRGGPAVTRKVRAGLQVPGATLQARAEPDLVAVQVMPRKGDPTQCELAITPRASLALGPFSCKVHVGAVLPGGERLPGAALSVWGNVRPAIRALPGELRLGRHKVGEVAEATVTLQAPEGQELAVDRIELDSADVLLQPVEASGPPSLRTFRVRHRITREGPQSNAVRFFVRRRAGEPPEPLALGVDYEGVALGPARAGVGRAKKP
jgi:hypothetical protein